jgi:hypothetical protein
VKEGEGVVSPEQARPRPPQAGPAMSGQR